MLTRAAKPQQGMAPNVASQAHLLGNAVPDIATQFAAVVSGLHDLPSKFGEACAIGRQKGLVGHYEASCGIVELLERTEAIELVTCPAARVRDDDHSYPAARQIRQHAVEGVTACQ